MCYSLFGWDHVTQGLVQLGFLLMDAFGPKTFGRVFIFCFKICAVKESLLLAGTFVTHESRTHFNRSFIPTCKEISGEILSLFTGESLLMPLSDGHLS